MKKILTLLLTACLGLSLSAQVFNPTLPPRLLGRGIIARAAVNESAVLIRELYSNNRRIEIGHKVSVTHSANVAK